MFGLVRNQQILILSPGGKPKSFDLLSPLRKQIDQIEIQSSSRAHWICRVVPSQCPFERDICLFGHKIAHIPPLCKLNPLYGELVSLRFRALCYLADTCGEDVQCYC